MFPGNMYGRTLHFGIREHAMGAICNGIALHGLTRPYGGTFLVFSDYMRRRGAAGGADGAAGDVRLDARLDRAGRGRARPTSRSSTCGRCAPSPAWTSCGRATRTRPWWPGGRSSAHSDRPAGLCLTRQNMPVLDRSRRPGPGRAEGTARGGYVLAEAAGGEPAVILIATGSEVQIALDGTRDCSQQEGIAARVVSMPCVEWFTEQEASYQEEVLPAQVRARVSVEAGHRARLAGLRR